MLNVLVLLELCLLMPSPEVPGEGSGRGWLRRSMWWLDGLPRRAGRVRLHFPQEYGSCDIMRNTLGKHKRKKCKEALVAALDNILRELFLTCDFAKGMKKTFGQTEPEM